MVNGPDVDARSTLNVGGRLNGPLGQRSHVRGNLHAMKEASEGELKGVLTPTKQWYRATHWRPHPYFDEKQASSSQFVKVVSWFDNEWAFSLGLTDLIARNKVNG